MIVNILMEESMNDENKHSKKLKERVSIDDLVEDEDNLMLRKEEEEKARKRTRGPYRKSSRVGLQF